MRKFKVIGSFVVLHSGQIRLTERQARDRAHAVKLVKDDLFEITGPVGFKFGEVFYFDGEIGKGHVEDVEESRGPGRPAIKGGKGKKDKTKKPEETETEGAEAGTEEDDTNPDGSEEGAEGAGN